MLTTWLEHLVDPGTREPLALEIDAVDGGHVISGRLRSAGGGVYPVTGGVPRFAIDPGAAAADVSDSPAAQTVRCYGDFWHRADEVQSGTQHSAAEISAYEQVLCGMLGVDSAKDLPALFGDGMNVLNAGCGVAWSEYLFNVNERTNRFGIDLSSSVDIAFSRTRDRSNVCIAQADIVRLPFAEAHFDVVFAGGVLHHIPDPAKAFASLCRHLKPGGLIGLFVYKVKPFLRELADREIKTLTTTMTPAECEAFAAQMAGLGKSLQRITETLVIDDDIPLLGITRGHYGVQKFIFDHFLKCYHNAALGFEHSVLANVDWYRPTHATHHTRDEITSWFTENHLEAMRFVEIPGWEHSSFFVSGRRTR